MDRPGNKRHVAVTYIVTAVIMFGIFMFTQWYNNMRAEQRAEANPDAAVTEEETAPEEEVLPEGTYAELSAEYCAANGYRYRIVTEAEELSALGLPEKVTEADLGGSFATADSNITLYAYPDYGCRAFLIAGREDAYSFCVLDGLTDQTIVPTLADVLPLYGIYSADHVSSIASAETLSVEMAELSDLLETFAGCTYAGDKTGTDGVPLSFTNSRGCTMQMTWYEDTALMEVGGMHFNISDAALALLK